MPITRMVNIAARMIRSARDFFVFFCAGVACFVCIVDFVCAAGHRMMSPVFAVKYLSAIEVFR